MPKPSSNHKQNQCTIFSLIFYARVGMKSCKHVASLSITKLSDRLSKNGIEKSPTETSLTEEWVCSICLHHFDQVQAAMTHGRRHNHQLFFRARPQEGFHCVTCNKDIDLEQGLSEKSKSVLQDAAKMIKDALGRSHVVAGKGEVSSPGQDTCESPMEIEMKPSGLVNLGNTCFMNSALQALTACFMSRIDDYENFDLDRLGSIGIALLGTIKSIPYKGSSEPVPSRPKGIKKKSSSHGNIVDPSTFLGSIGKKFREFRRLRQQDSHDFLRLLFNALDDEHAEKKKAGTVAKDSLAIHQELFGGKLGSKVTCKACKNVTEVEESFLDLSLAIPPADEDSLVKQFRRLRTDGESVDEDDDLNLLDLIQFWARPAQLEAENSFACEHCPKIHPNDDDGGVGDQRKFIYRPATQQFFLKSLPRHLIIHFQRFSISSVGKRGIRLSKNHTHVNIPETLDLSQFCSHYNADQASSSYRLTALVMHEGSSVDSGHYVSAVRYDPSRGIWWYASDTLVRQLPSISGLNPYLVFYTRI